MTCVLLEYMIRYQFVYWSYTMVGIRQFRKFKPNVENDEILCTK